MNHVMAKKLLAAVLMMICCCHTSMAQRLLTYRVVGDVTYTAQGKPVPLMMNTSIDYQTEINIPYGAKVELMDEGQSKRLILQKPGKGSVKTHAEEAGNKITSISSQYLAYVKKQMTNKGLASQQRYCDFATVTRVVDSVPDGNAASLNGQASSLRSRYNAFSKQSKEKYISFREECNRKYIEFVRQAWATYGPMPAVERPAEPWVEPQYVPDSLADKPIPLLENQKCIAAEEQELPAPVIETPLPINPVEPIKEVEQDEEDREFCSMPFSFYGTDLRVRLDERRRINLGRVTPDRVADALQHFSTKEYDNLLYDCLKIRNDYKLCDWAYLLMLKSLTDQYSGAGTDESALLLGYLYYQSGYKVRFATDNNRLYLLVASPHIIFEKGPYVIDDEMYYPLEDVGGILSVCGASFPKERTLSLYIPDQPLLNEGESQARRITSRRYPDISVEVSVSKNLLDFYGNYPSSYIGDDFTTRWAMYANTPMAKNVRQSIYPALQEKLAGLSQADAVNRLLNFVQTGFKYEYDDKVWGGDRAFFAEETLHYPFCDCEDRSILFTRLVRDILNLDCVLVYYPGHLAAAVHFDEHPGGTFYTTADGKDYTVCDPTYIGASAGMPMPQFKKAEAKLIHLKN